MKTASVILAACLTAALTGCQGNGRTSFQQKELDSLRLKKTQLSRQLAQMQAENEQLRKQVDVLTGLKPAAELEKFYALWGIKVARYTNLYDKDKDGKKEKLIVYLEPIDKQGDAIKACGAVDVQLWDLGKTKEQALLGQWHVTPEELTKLWSATLLSSNYRLTFDVSDIVIGPGGPLTVKVTFTDYLSGTVFTEQNVINP